MNSRKTSPVSRLRGGFRVVFGKSKVRPVALFIIMAALATAAFSATSSAGALNRIIFGGSGGGGTSPDSGGGLKAVAAGVMAMLSPEPQATPTPTPTPATLLNARRGHTATLLDGGKVLIVGGDDAGTAEVFDAAAQTSAVTNGLSVPRSDHTATRLADGRVIVIGGRSGGTAVNTTEIYKPATASFEAGPTLGVARAGHSATLLSDGTILVAGGVEGGSAEIFNPAADANAPGTVSTSAMGARSMHSAVLMRDGRRVLVVGGRDAGGNALATAEIFDPAASAFSPVGNSLKVARVRAHLRVLFDEKVQIIGGSDDGSMEVYDPLIDTVGAYAHVLPETDTCAGLHAHVMASQTRAALFRNGQADPLLDRTGQTITELPGTNRALVAGGVNSGGSTLNSFAILSSSPSTITTDKLDYSPGEVATITGRGFQPGETVRVKIHEDPHTPQERGFDITADANGDFSGTYDVRDYDLNMKFIVGARGLSSGWTAQTTFTDGNVGLRVVYSPATSINFTLTEYNNPSCLDPSTSSKITAVTSVTTLQANTPYVNLGGIGGTKSGQITLPAGYTATTWTLDNSQATIVSKSSSHVCFLVAGNNDKPDFTVVLGSSNTAPVATNDSYSVNEDATLNQAASGGVLANDTDANNNTLTVATPRPVTGPTQGTLTLAANGSFVYTPNANFNGTDTFTYRANDGTTDSNLATVTITINAINDAPVAVNDAANTNEDTFVDIDVIANDTDIDNSNVNLSVLAGSITAVAGGTAVLQPDGRTVRFTPAANANVGNTPGGFSFKYKAKDSSNAESNEATVTVSVAAVNDAPVAQNDALTTAEDTQAVVAAPGVLGNDADVDGNALTAIVVAAPAHGTLALNANGSFTYTPAPNFFGGDSFTYKANDGTADSNVATVTLTVSAVNDAPLANDDSYSVNEDMTLGVTATGPPAGVLANDTDVDSASLTAALVSNPTHGALTLNADGSFTYTPTADYNGADSFTYKANDGSLDSNVATVTITVNPVNDAPVVDLNGPDTPGHPETAGVDYSAAFTEGDSPVSIVSNPADVGKKMTVSDVDSPSLSSATITITNLQDDGAELLDADVTPLDASNSEITTNITKNYDAATGVLTLSGVDSVANYQAVLRTVTYRNTSENPGTTARSIVFVVNDGTDNSAAATSTVTVTAINDAPVAVDDTASTDEDVSLNLTQADLKGNDTDVDHTNAQLSVTAVSNPAHGAVEFNGSGGITFTPDANFNGAAGFDYTVSDGDKTDTGHVTITVKAVNDAPTAEAQSVITDEDTTKAMTLSASDVDGDTLSYSVVSGPSHGSLTGSGANQTYTPAANYNGPDSFTFKADDGSLSSTATVSITVNPVNDVPVANDGTATTAEDTASSPIDLGAHVSDVETSDVDLTYAVVGNPTNGSLSGSGQSRTYTPNADFNGTDTFTYKVTDRGDPDNCGAPSTTCTAAVTSATKTVTITVTEVNDPPAAADDGKTTAEDTPLSFPVSDLTGNDSAGPANESAQTLTVISVGSASHGSVSLVSGQITYTPAAEYNGPDSFTYIVQDNGTTSGVNDFETATATVQITVTEVNDTPTAVADNVTTAEDTPIGFAASGLTANDSAGPANEGSQTLTVTAVTATPSTHGTVSLDSGTITYTPDADYNGPAGFGYTVCDNGTTNGVADHKCVTGTVNVTVSESNDPPSAANDNKTTAEDTPLSFPAADLTGNDSAGPANEASQTLTVTAVAATADTHGTVSLSSSTVTYTPDANYNGPASFEYTVCDDGTTAGAADPECTTGTVNVTVTAVNDVPVVYAGLDAMINEGDAFSSSGSFTDPDNPDSWTATVNYGDGSGTHPLTLTPGKTFSLNHVYADNGTYTVTVTVTDSANASGSDTAQVVVNNVKPVVTGLALSANPIHENDSVTLNGTFTDPGTNDTHTVVINWADGSPSTTVNLPAGVLTFTASHQYLDDNPNGTALDVYGISVTVTDKDGGAGGGSKNINVNNVAPVISAATGPAAPQALGSTSTVSAPFTDVGTQDTHTCTVNWDDGPPTGGTVTEVNGSGTCTASRTYASPGVYTVTMTVTDDDTGRDSKTLETFIVVFDPSGGFVTGGGFIMSPAGASTLYPTAAGKASFGFVSKYKRGSNVPEGQTEFQFKAGDLNFHSSAYDPGSLVVSGHKATYRGTGTVNGVPGYRFVLIAYDGQAPGGGGVDKFRMKITLGGAVIYDNRMNVSEDLDLADPMAISGGSIVIHSK